MAKAFCEFVKENRQEVTQWKGTSTNAVELFESQFGKAE